MINVNDLFIGKYVVISAGKYSGMDGVVVGYSQDGSKVRVAIHPTMKVLVNGNQVSAPERNAKPA